MDGKYDFDFFWFVRLKYVWVFNSLSCLILFVDKVEFKDNVCSLKKFVVWFWFVMLCVLFLCFFKWFVIIFWEVMLMMYDCLWNNWDLFLVLINWLI